jgi:tetrahydromethanopterin S-methyltransferase subunit H
MEELIKLAKLTYELEQHKLKTITAVHYAFKHEEEFLKMENTIIDSMIMACPQGSRVTIRSGTHTYPRWSVDTRKAMTEVLDMVRRFSKFEKKKDEKKEDVEIVNQPEAKRQRTD